MNYYIQNENEKIILFNTDLERITNTFGLMPQYADLEIQETERKIIQLDNEFVFADEHQAEIAQKEREKKDMLFLTRGDVFTALMKARMVTRANLKAMVEQMPEETEEEQIAKECALIALEEALNFHRGHALVNIIGAELGISSENLDLFFETNDYTYLLPTEIEEN